MVSQFIFNMMKSGYTFIELMVVIAIIAVLALISFPYYQRAKGQFTIERTAIALTQDLRRTQEMAMSAVEFGGAIPSGGYGIYIDLSGPDHYILFADLDVDELCDQPSEVIEDISLEGDTKISALGNESFLCPGGACTHIVVIFKPPDPEVVIRGKVLSSFWIDLPTAGIKIGLNALQKDIFANSAGLIYAE